MIRNAFLICSLLASSATLFQGCEATPDSPSSVVIGTNGPAPNNPSPNVPGLPTSRPLPEPAQSPNPTMSPDVTFCFWNVENLFDDVFDRRSQAGDKEFDEWLSHNPQMLREKLNKLTEALLSINEGRGPDILCVAEVEGIRAATLLQYALNERLQPALQYRFLAMKEVKVGRHIAPAVISRIPIVGDRTQLLNSRNRILQTTLKVNGRELVVIASHWTSRLQDTAEGQRKEYGDKIYGACRAMYQSNPGVDIIVCGDFNDTPQDPSVTQHLRATGNYQQLQRGGDLFLYNLFADKNPNAGFGTNFYQKWQIFDQIAVSPGMFDNRGWQCDPTSGRTINYLTRPGDTSKRPWRFGGEKDAGPRGYSDHFPVVAKLRVAL